MIFSHLRVQDSRGESDYFISLFPRLYRQKAHQAANTIYQMKFFVHSQRDIWHKNVDADIGSEYPCLADGSINPLFPWSLIKAHTEALLKKKGITLPEEQDNFLLGLVCRHGATVNALAACAYGLSPKTIKACLTGEFGRLSGLHNEISTYLQAVIAIHHTNSTAITAIDAGLAKALLPLCGLDVTAAGQVLQIATTLWVSGVPTGSLVQDEIEVITQKACKNFAGQLNTVVSGDLWFQAAKDASWIPTLSNNMTRSPSENKLNRILSKDFPEWRAWAAWRPNSARLKLWGNCTPDQRLSLHHLLALEGPDLKCQLHQTLKEHLASSKADLALEISTSRIQFAPNTTIEAQFDMLCRLLDQVDNACAGTPAEIELLVHLIGDEITSGQLELFDAVHVAANTSISIGVFELLRGNAETTKLLTLLSCLGNPEFEPVKSAISKQLINAFTSRFKELRQTTLSRISAAPPSGGEELRMITELHKFGQAMHDAKWFLEMLKPSHQNLLRSWPRAKVATTWYSVREAAEAYPSKSFHNVLNQYFIHHFIHPISQQYGFQVAETLIDLWSRPSFLASRTRCRLSLLIASGVAVDTAFRSRCIAQLSILADDFIDNLLSIFEICEAQPIKGIADLTKLLASGLSENIVQCWRVALVRLIEQQGQNLLHNLLDTLSTDSWVEMLRGLRTVFQDEPEFEGAGSHAILRPSLRVWGEFLDQHVQTIQRVESAIAKSPAMYCILTGAEGPVCSTVLKILEALAAPFIGPLSTAAFEHEMLAHLAADGSNAEIILKAICCLRNTSFEGYNACERIAKCEKDLLPPTADVILAGFLHSEDMMDGDKADLKVLAEVLGIQISASHLPSDGSIELTDDFLIEEVNELFEEAKRLESLVLAFKNLDSDGMHKLLLDLGIEDTSPLDDMFVELPSEIADVVERLSDSIVEIQLPLTQLTAFTRRAMGAPNAQNLILRLQMEETGLGFCIHFDDALRAAPAGAMHLPFYTSSDLCSLEVSICDTRATPALIHLSRTLHRRLRSHPASLAEIQQLMTTTISNLCGTCIICGATHIARLCRSSPCALPECRLAFSNTLLEVCLADIRQDPAAADLLITGVYAASSAGKFDMLPGHPIQASSVVQQELNALPPIARLTTAEHLDNEINQLQDGTRALLVWIMTAFRGYLVSATGSLKIPSLPGVHQFFLANTNPEKEREFTDRINAGMSRRVLFHGTTLDRLYAILCQGLKVMSGTALQRNGASFGNGIYMGEEPSTAWPYTQTFAKGWKNSQFSSFKVLLGCEHVGTTTASSRGIYVIKDPAALMVRYIFLMPPHQTVPVARHLVPAMESVFANLRAGTI